MNNQYLIHYGVKGMKWGVRHDRPRKGRKRKMSTRTKILIGAAVVAGLGALTLYGGKAYISYGIKHADNIIKAGTTLRRHTQNPEGVEKGMAAYFAQNKRDSDKYRGFFGKYNKPDGFGNLDVVNKDSVEAKVVKDIKVAGIDTGRKEFENLYNSNKEFKNYIDNNFKGFGLPLNKQTWEKFNTRALLRNPNTGELDKGAALYIDSLKNKGYHGVADVNDRLNSGFNTKAHILFDYRDKISNIKVSKISDADIQAAKKRVWKRQIIDQTLTGNAGYVAAGAAVVAGGSYVEDRSDETAKKKN